jgi:hypothetical protein
LAILEALAPDTGWTTDLAILSTYSVDLVAAAAMVVALAGEGDDHEQMRGAGLARACERMRDRFRIICQAGRIAVPGAGAKGLVLSDRWVREVHHDGNDRSWHAKMGLVRYSEDEKGEGPRNSMWRLWVGSRNLTRDTSWDSALLAEGYPAGAPSSEAATIAEAGALLAGRAELPDWPIQQVLKELHTLKWRWPKEITKFYSFDFWTDKNSAPGFPEPPKGLERVVAVSPFIDADSALAVASWGGLNRQLLTIPRTMEALAQHRKMPLAGFTSLHQIEGPAAPDDPGEYRDPTEEDQLVEVHRGLHAKLIWAQTHRGDHLWLGSANLTRRAWDGRNSEVMIHVGVTPSVGQGLCEGIVEGLAKALGPDDEFMGTFQEDEKAQQLETLRNRIAGHWTGTLRACPDGPGLQLEVQNPPIEAADQVKLKVRLLGTKDFQNWQPGGFKVHLPGVALYQQTELLELVLSSQSQGVQPISWMARAPFDPEPGIDRDRAVLAWLMGPRALLAWLGSLLDEVSGDPVDPPWPEKEESHALDPVRPLDMVLAAQTPTLEAVLRAWARKPDSVRQVDRAMLTWAKDILDMPPEEMDEPDRASRELLIRFMTTWQTIRVGLGLDGAAT